MSNKGRPIRPPAFLAKQNSVPKIVCSKNRWWRIPEGKKMFVMVRIYAHLSERLKQGTGHAEVKKNHTNYTHNDSCKWGRDKCHFRQ